jgi:hypothetical protein
MYQQSAQIGAKPCSIYNNRPYFHPPPGEFNQMSPHSQQCLFL